MNRASLRLPSPVTGSSIHRLGAVFGLLLLTSCSQQTGVETQHPLHGIVGQQLVALDDSMGVAAELLTSPTLTDLGALTYAADCDCFYAVVDSTHDPVLMRLDRRTGEVEKVTPLVLPDLVLNRVEALAWNSQEGLLYGAGGFSTFASNRLFSVDPSNRRIRDLGPIKGTYQNEADALAFAGGKLLAIDSAAQTSQLYTLEVQRRRVRARALGKPFTGTVVDMEFDPDRTLLLAVEASAGRLLTFDMDGRPLTPGDGTTAEGLSGLALVKKRHLVPTMIFSDGFESGTALLWSAQEGQVEDP